MIRPSALSAASCISSSIGFRELPDIHRAVLVLREVQGLSYDEIADALEIKKGTVMSRLFHARKAMQAQMAMIQKAEAKGGVR